MILRIARLALKFPLSFLDTPASAFALFQGVAALESSVSELVWSRTVHVLGGISVGN